MNELPDHEQPVVAIRATIRGIVQGVGYRYATRDAARRLGLVGWVQNLSDGAVEVVAQGPQHDVDDLVGFLGVGPRLADVASVEVVDVPVDPDLTEFQVGF